MREIGEELDVATILEGDVQRAGDAVRINVQLIDAETDEHLWAEIYQRQLTAENMFAIQNEMATAIASALQATLSPQEIARLEEVPTRNTRAYELYLSALEEVQDVARRTELYGQAVAFDPQFALAWAGLSSAHGLMRNVLYDRTESRLSASLAAVQRALELDPDLPEAHLAMANYHYNERNSVRDYELALNELAIAEQGMPLDATPLNLRSQIFRRLGQWEQAEETIAQAFVLDPRNVRQQYNRGQNYHAVRDYAQADQYFARALELNPEFGQACAWRSQIPWHRDGDVTDMKAAYENPPFDLGDERYWLGWNAAIYERDYPKALMVLEGWESDEFTDQYTYALKTSLHGVTYQLAGQLGQAEVQFQSARGELEELLEGGIEDSRIYISLGEAMAALGEREGAISSARQAMEITPTSVDKFWGPIFQLDAVVRVFIPAGDYEAAIEELTRYFSSPGRWSIEGLARDPRLDPISDDPRFIALVEKYRRQ